MSQRKPEEVKTTPNYKVIYKLVETLPVITRER